MKILVVSHPGPGELVFHCMAKTCKAVPALFMMLATRYLLGPLPVQSASPVINQMAPAANIIIRASGSWVGELGTN